MPEEFRIGDVVRVIGQRWRGKTYQQPEIGTVAELTKVSGVDVTVAGHYLDTDCVEHIVTDAQIRDAIRSIQESNEHLNSKEN